MQRGHISEVFVNILQNAREAMQGKGAIMVGTRYGENYSVVVTISDNGPGIPPEKVSQIFEPYFTTKEKGTGLGLAIVKHNTEIYGGTVDIESELGNGTRFTINLPARTLMRIRST
jgi:signal transduction histidine kinase